MNILLFPIVTLMQRMRLLPKFALVTLVFMAPLLVALSLLYIELHKSVTTAERERLGVRYARALEESTRLLQQHRALRHIQLSGNAEAAEPAAQTAKAVDSSLAAVDAMEKAAPEFDAAAAWAKIRQDWKAVQSRLQTAKAKESYADHSALIDQIGKLKTLVADRSGLARDPETGSHHLSNVMVNGFPGVADLVAQIAGRGAAYIDTGLLEANEDLLLNSSVMVARRDLAGIPAQFDTVFRESPALRAQLEPKLASVPQALAFLDRAQSEVLNSYNQTSGMQFFDAGKTSIDALYASAAAAADTLDALLGERISRYSTRLNLIVLAMLFGLALTAWLLAGFYVAFSREVKELEQAVESAAAGDLTNRISSHAKDEIGSLVNAFGKMNTELAQLVSKVRAGSETITQAAHAIAADSANLSTRTESQASALQQTAGAMEELTSIVRQNDDNANEASRLVASASQVASKGGEVVGQVVQTMSSIKQSSHKIIDIIQVIDSIAFQTNILALNAAVEAARAGEQGKGFAVVAGEVRALAQRSAGAAKEIKALIQHSVGQIENGNTLVGAAGATMREIVSSVEHVAGIMSSITAASREQTKGIEQVNQSIGQMDAVTQRNAALVEHAAAAAASLQDQALGLSQAVSAFKLEEESERPPLVEVASAARITDGKTALLHSAHSANAANLYVPRLVEKRA